MYLYLIIIIITKCKLYGKIALFVGIVSLDFNHQNNISCSENKYYNTQKTNDVIYNINLMCKCFIIH